MALYSIEKIVQIWSSHRDLQVPSRPMDGLMIPTHSSRMTVLELVKMMNHRYDNEYRKEALPSGEMGT